jgi:hypothetical protein
MGHPIHEQFDDPHGLTWKQWLLLLLALFLGFFAIYVVNHVPFTLDQRASSSVEVESRSLDGAR